MVDHITKVLAKTSKKDLQKIQQIFLDLIDKKTDHLDIKKLKKSSNYRIRSGNYRIIVDKNWNVIDVRRRNKNTY